MKIAAAKTVRRLEAQAQEKLKIAEKSLMEKASELCAWHIHSFKQAHDALRGLPTVIFAGKGNNGGDGILTGGYLSSKYHEQITIYSLQTPAEMSDEIRRHFFALPKDVKVVFINDKNLQIDLHTPSLIIDAILGIGFKGELRGTAKKLINLINSSNNPVVSIDVPSGIETDSGDGQEAVFADLTLTIGAQKRGLYVSDGRIHSGRVEFLDIGFDIAQIPDSEVEFEVISDVMPKLFPRRREEFYKTRNGKLLVIGGSESYPGAVVLSTLGANGAGCGLLSAAIKKRPYSSFLPSVIVRDFSSSGGNCFNQSDIPELKKLAMMQDCVVFGMGVTVGSEIAGVLKMLLQNCDRLLLDADALNTLALFPELWQFKKHKNIVLTPHHQEAVRLAAAFKIAGFEAMERPQQAAVLAEKLQCTVVLKGEKTLIASVDLPMFVNPVGSCALAKGGSGDILSGIIGALLAREKNMSCHELAACGVWLHAAAADFAAQSRTAFDINDLPQALKKYIDSITLF